MKRIIVAFALILTGYTTFAQDTNKLLSDYIAVKNALVNGDSKAAAQAVVTFQQTLNAGGDFAEKASLLKDADKVAKAGNIEKQRAGFSDLSTDMWKVVEKTDHVNSPVYYQYCPMKKAYWLSQEKVIKNPYYGSAMHSCGSVTATK
jgi:hypothetical protein